MKIDITNALLLKALNQKTGTIRWRFRNGETAMITRQKAQWLINLYDFRDDKVAAIIKACLKNPRFLELIYERYCDVNTPRHYRAANQGTARKSQRLC